MNDTRTSLVPVRAEVLRKELTSLVAEARKKELQTSTGDAADIVFLSGQTTLTMLVACFDEPSASTGLAVGVTSSVAEHASTALPDPVHHANRRALQRGLTTLARLRASSDDGLRAPLMRAEWWLENFAELLSIYDLELRAPHATTTDSEVVFEWWVGDRKLTAYFSSTSIDYVKVWGADVSDEMEDGPLDLVVAVGLWRWLNGKA